MYSKSNSVTKEMLNFKRKLQIWVKLLSFALHANMTIKIVSTARPRDTRFLGPEKNRAAQNRTS